MKNRRSYEIIRRFFSLTAILLLVAIIVSPVMAATPFTQTRHVFINVANDAGVKFNEDGAKYGGPSNTYYILADGGGLNQLHVSTNNNGPGNFGEVTTSTEQSGTFYLTTTGGQGYNDDILLLISVQDPVPDDFTVRIKSSGYQWTPTGKMPTSFTHGTGIDETFSDDDFIYGPETWKPGPGSYIGSPLNEHWLPLYNGQDITDGSTNSHLMFVDLNVGNMNSGAIDNGAVKVEYSFTNLHTSAAFNVYAWRLEGKDAQGISWTNKMVNPGASGYYVTGQAIPSPEFPSMALPAALLVGMLGAVLFIRRTKEN